MSQLDLTYLQVKRAHALTPFPPLEEVTAAVTRNIRGLNKSGSLNGIANLPKRWDAVIEKQGDFIEGL
jgi:hypothetical protein